MNGNKAGLTDIKWIHTILLPLRVLLALTLPLSVPLIPIPRTAPFSPIGPDVLSKLSPLTTLFHQSRRVAFEAVELAELLPACSALLDRSAGGECAAPSGRRGSGDGRGRGAGTGGVGAGVHTDDRDVAVLRCNQEGREEVGEVE